MLKAPVVVEICRIVESGNETDKKPNARTPKSSRRKDKKALRKEEQVSEDADALPTIFEDPHTTLEEQPVSTGARSSPGPADLRIATCSAITTASSTRTEEASTPLKRKASPAGVMSPTSSKRPRSS